MSTQGRPYNFAAGPAMLPESVLLQAQEGMLNYKGSGSSVMELSHRGRVFTKIIEDAEADLRTLLGIPDEFAVLFLQGGATGQFAALPLNLLGEKTKVDIVRTGVWSAKAVEEASKYCEVNIAADTKSSAFVTAPSPDTWKLSGDAAYVYYCDNETINGVEFPAVAPETNGVPLVVDSSSNFLSRRMDVSKYDVIYGGAQKNCGIAGVTIVIIRKSLLRAPHKQCPVVLDYLMAHKNQSMYNTPPCWAIFVSGLVFKWLLENGGLEAAEQRNEEKAKLLYDCLDASKLFYTKVEKGSRSRMNVTFLIRDDPDGAILKQFTKEAKAVGLCQLKGHRSVGGLRASIYNAMPLAGVQALVDFIKAFESRRASQMS